MLEELLCFPHFELVLLDELLCFPYIENTKAPIRKSLTKVQKGVTFVFCCFCHFCVLCSPKKKYFCDRQLDFVTVCGAFMINEANRIETSGGPAMGANW